MDRNLDPDALHIAPQWFREDIRWFDPHRYTIEGHTLEGTYEIKNSILNWHWYRSWHINRIEIAPVPGK